VPEITVITPTARGADTLRQIVADMAAQTYRDFEHRIIYDGPPPAEVLALLPSLPPWVWFEAIEKAGDTQTGTTPRNVGTQRAAGRYVVYADDDDRYRSTYISTLMSHTVADTDLTVVQMACEQSRVSRNGDPGYVVAIPEPGLPMMPTICHIGTPCYIVPTAWALADPWRDEPEHDFHFFDRIVQKYRPRIHLVPSVQVDVDGVVMGGDPWY